MVSNFKIVKHASILIAITAIVILGNVALLLS